VVGYPSAGELAGRGLELALAPAGKGGERDAAAHSFAFDKVFVPGASQVGGGRQACRAGSLRLAAQARIHADVCPAACPAAL
jgi:hypothetical protein